MNAIVPRISGLAPQRFASDLTLGEVLRQTLAAGGVEASAARPYEQVAAVYAAIRPFAETLAELPITLHRGNTVEPLERGPAVELLARPAHNMGWAEWVEQISGHLLEGGEAHLLLVRDARGRVSAANVVGRRQMAVRTLRGATVWIYHPESGAAEPLLPEEHGYVRLWNPYDALRGLSPLAAAALAIQQSRAAAMYNAATLVNGSGPGATYSTDADLSDEQIKEFLERIKARHGGAANAGRPALLTGGIKYAAAAYSNTDLQLYDGMRFSREEIAAAIGTPPVLMGIYESAHYDVADAAIRIFLKHKVAPMARRIGEFVSRALLARVERDARVLLRVDQHPAILEEQRGKADALTKLVATGVPYNQAVTFLGLPFSAQEWGDVSLMSGALDSAARLASGDAGAGGGLGELPLPQEPEAPAAAQNAAAVEFSAAAERRFERGLIEQAARPIRRRFEAWFIALERGVLRRLKRAVKSAAAAAERFEGSADEALWDIVAEQDKLRGMAREYVSREMERAVRAELTRRGASEQQVAAALQRIRASRWYEAYARIKQARIAGVERTLRERLRSSLADGAEKGEGLAELSERVHAILGESAGRLRSRVIAENEAGQSISLGRFAASAAAGTRGKSWSTGANPRATHAKAGAAYPASAAIPLNEPFEVGDEALMFPRDPSGSAKEIVNCNCVFVPQAAAESRESAA